MKIYIKNKINLTALPFFLLFFIIVISQQTLQSQPIFSSGIVIKAPGDTLRGEIGEFGGNKNYQECVFRSVEGAIQRFTPQEIKGYVITNRRYFESRTVPQPQGDSSVFFMEYIIRSSTSMVKVKKIFYLLHPADTLQMVPFRPLEATKTKESYRLARRTWLLFLNNLARNCATLKTYFEKERNLESKEENLIQIIKLYNDCQGTSYEEYGVGLPFIAADVGISLSLDYTNLNFTSTIASRYPYLLEPNFTTLGPAVGVGMLIWSPRRLSTFGFYIEPSIRAYRLEADVYSEETLNNADKAYYHTKINWVGLGSPMAIRYTIPNRKPTISFQAGPTLQLLLDTKAETMEELVAQEFLQERTIVTTNSFASLEFSKFQLGFGGQANIRQQWSKLPGSWEFALGFQRGGGIVLEDTLGTYGLLESKTTSFFVKVLWLW